MPAPDPDFWQEATKWLAGILVVPLGFIWRKVNNSVQKEEFMEFCERFDKHCEHDTEVQGKIFDFIRENEQRAQDRHERLLEKLSPRE